MEDAGKQAIINLKREKLTHIQSEISSYESILEMDEKVLPAELAKKEIKVTKLRQNLQINERDQDEKTARMRREILPEANLMRDMEREESRLKERVAELKAMLEAGKYIY